MSVDWTEITVYTRYGVKEGRHYEMRCTASKHGKKCQRGFWHGFHVINNEKLKYEYDDDCLDGCGEDRYLISSDKTAFSVKQMYSCTVKIICHKTSFLAMTDEYNLTHSAQTEEDVVGVQRVKLHQDRLSEAWYLYAMIEQVRENFSLKTDELSKSIKKYVCISSITILFQKQRYLVRGPVSRGDEVDVCLGVYKPLLKHQVDYRD